jgi:hypothetical protein
MIEHRQPSRQVSAVATATIYVELLDDGATSSRRLRTSKRLSRKVDAPELACDRVTNAARRCAFAARPLALKLRICHLNRHRPRDRFGRLCVTHNRDGLCDTPETIWIVRASPATLSPSLRFERRTGAV